MACGSCRKRREKKYTKGIYQVMGEYKYLPDNQIKARLEVFKKKYCSDCPTRYDCDFNIHTNCKTRPK